VRVRLPLDINLRSAIRICVADLIASWDHYDTNRRRAKGCTSPLQRNLRRSIMYHVNDLIAGCGHCATNKRHTLLDMHLLFDASYGQLGCRLHSGASQDLTATLYLHK
jgi:hypothetical protein